MALLVISDKFKKYLFVSWAAESIIGHHLLQYKVEGPKTPLEILKLSIALKIHLPHFCVPKIWVPSSARWNVRLTDNCFPKHYLSWTEMLFPAPTTAPNNKEDHSVIYVHLYHLFVYNWSKQVCTMKVLYYCSCHCITSKSMLLHSPSVKVDVLVSISGKVIISFCTAPARLFSLHKKLMNSWSKFSRGPLRCLGLDLCAKTEGTALGNRGEETALRTDLVAAF